jgi:Coenzyme PQQ synthesis protein D (PqqD)
MKPERRRDGLVVKELPEEVLVYDLERHRAHCLNPAAAAVFKSCDGERTVGEIARILRRETGAPADEAWVHLALDRLEKAHLLEERSAPSAGRGVSRRDVLKKAGVGLAAALPLVTSIVAPTPVEAAATCVECCSGKPDGTPCANPIALCSGTCSCQSGICVGGCSGSPAC